MKRRTPKTWIISAVASAALAVGAVAVTSQGSGAAPVATASTASTASADASASTSVVNAMDTTTEPSTDLLAAIETDADYSVSVLDVDTGESLQYGSGSFDTASIVKVDILAALLHQHEEAGTTLSDSEQELAAAMIERSDNEAATTLFEAVGGEAGLEAFNADLGLTETDIGSDGNWGLTQTTSADQITLLQAVLGEDSVLSASSQAYAESLMGDVVDSQNFGVSAAADDADDAVLKVGYLQRSATGLWDVTSIGRIQAGGHTYLVAVLSDSSSSFEAGVTLVDEVAQAAVSGMSAI